MEHGIVVAGLAYDIDERKWLGGRLGLKSVEVSLLGGLAALVANHLVAKCAENIFDHRKTLNVDFLQKELARCRHCHHARCRHTIVGAKLGYYRRIEEVGDTEKQPRAFVGDDARVQKVVAEAMGA